MGKIEKWHNPDTGEVSYPVTNAKAVFLSDGSCTVESKLNGLDVDIYGSTTSGTKAKNGSYYYESLSESIVSGTTTDTNKEISQFITLNVGEILKVQNATSSSMLLNYKAPSYSSILDREYDSATNTLTYKCEEQSDGSSSIQVCLWKVSFPVSYTITKEGIKDQLDEIASSSSSVEVDGTTIDTNASGELIIKDGGVTEDKLSTALATKINNAGSGTTDNNYTNADKAKLAALPTNAELTASLGLKADKASPALTGTPTAPTAASGTNTTQIATTAFVTTAVEAEATARTSAIAAETAARTAAEATLTSNLETEVTAREAAIDNINAAITSGVGTTSATILPSMTSSETSVTDGVSAKGIVDYVAEQKALTDADVSELALKINAVNAGVYYGYYASAASLPTTSTEKGYAYVGTTSPFSVYNYNGTTWTNSGATISNVAVVADGTTIEQNAAGKLTVKIDGLSDGDTIVQDANGKLKVKDGFAEDLFWCGYNYTTQEQILDAIYNGKLPVYNDGNIIYIFSRIEELPNDKKILYFQCFNSGSNTVYTIGVNPYDEWQTSEILYAKATDLVSLHNDIEKKQDKLTAGDNITIASDGTISATGGGAIDKVKVNGTELSIESTDKSVDIPAATSTSYGVVKVWTGTKAEYDAITTKDASCFYCITE